MCSWFSMMPCPECQTTISDAEVNHIDTAAHFYHVEYPIVGTNERLRLATTRPETIPTMRLRASMRSRPAYSPAFSFIVPSSFMTQMRGKSCRRPTSKSLVLETFCSLYEKGYIYRGEKIINWCPECQTTISDAEVNHIDPLWRCWHGRCRVPRAR